MSHKIADGTSLVMFMTSWAQPCMGDNAGSVLQPDFNLASQYFPPKNFSLLGSKPHDSRFKEQKFVAKRLVFNNEKLSKLKNVYLLRI